MKIRLLMEKTIVGVQRVFLKGISKCTTPKLRRIRTDLFTFLIIYFSAILSWCKEYLRRFGSISPFLSISRKSQSEVEYW